MRKPGFLSVFILICLSCRSAEKQAMHSLNRNDLKITWKLESVYTNSDYPTMPITQISVQINNQTYSLITDAQGEYQEMDETESRGWDIPESAISTCFGGWAGLYRSIYIEKTEQSLVIKQAWSDAESEIDGWMDIEILKTIPLSKVMQ